jgi:SAM-dependent methyltransferase
MVALRDIYRAFAGHGLLTQVYLRVKLRICPVRRVETYLPPAGRVLDLGCGNGLMAALFMLGSSRRRVTGFDLDPGKVRAARRLKARWPSLEFEVADLAARRFPACESAVLVDVLYLIPRPKQDAILAECYRALRPGGLLLLKEMDTRPRWKYAWNYFQETLAVKVLGFTLGGRFYFRPRADCFRTLEGLGFRVRVVRLDRGYAYPHILYLCRKP